MTAIKGFVTQVKTHPALTLGGTAIIGTVFAGLPGALFGVTMGAIIVGYDGVKSLFVGIGGSHGGGGDPGIRPEFAGESDPADRPFEKAFLMEEDAITPSQIRSSDFGGADEARVAKSAFFGDDGSDDQGGDDGPPAADDGGGGGGGGGSDGGGGAPPAGSPPAATPPAAGPKPSPPTGQSAPAQKRVAMRLPPKRR
jgi:hypothetical protein